MESRLIVKGLIVKHLNYVVESNSDLADIFRTDNATKQAIESYFRILEKLLLVERDIVTVKKEDFEKTALRIIASIPNPNEIKVKFLLIILSMVVVSLFPKEV